MAMAEWLCSAPACYLGSRSCIFYMMFGARASFLKESPSAKKAPPETGECQKTPTTGGQGDWQRLRRTAKCRPSAEGPKFCSWAALVPDSRCQVEWLTHLKATQWNVQISRYSICVVSGLACLRPIPIDGSSWVCKRVCCIHAAYNRASVVWVCLFERLGNARACEHRRGILIHISKTWENKLPHLEPRTQRVKDSKHPGLKDSSIKGHKSSGIQGLKDSKAHGWKN